MLVEVAADHLAVLRPFGERDGGAVDADEAFAVVMDEGQEVGLLLVVHFQRAAGIEQHRVEIVQVFGVVLELLLGQRLGVGADHGVPQAGLAAQALDGRHGVRHGFVPVALLFADHQQLLARRGWFGRHAQAAGLLARRAWAGTAPSTASWHRTPH